MASEPAKSANPLPALIAGIFLTVCCNPLVGIIMVILAVMAIMKEDDSPEEAKLTRYAWIVFGVGVSITVLIALIAFAIGLVPGWEAGV